MPSIAGRIRMLQLTWFVHDLLSIDRAFQQLNRG